jgi:hypothetical protein
MNDKLTQLVNGLADDVRPEVQRIEAKIAITQNHYGDYMNLLSTVSGGNSKVGKLMGMALIQAGANSAGVNSALQVLGW